MSELRDITAKEITGIQIDYLRHKLWVCVDGECVLRVKSPQIELEDQSNKAYKEGLKAGITAFAWWKDGVQYVGTCGKTLKEALELVDKGEIT